jgi:hypothetical protein
MKFDECPAALDFNYGTQSSIVTNAASENRQIEVSFNKLQFIRVDSKLFLTQKKQQQ